LGIGIALFMYAAVYYGPTDFLYYVFEKDLARESSTPIIHLLLMLARVTSISTILIVATGLFIVNLFTFLLTFKKLPSVLAEFLYKTKRNHSEI
jgi:hypothetical protein